MSPSVGLLLKRGLVYRLCTCPLFILGDFGKLWVSLWDPDYS